MDSKKYFILFGASGKLGQTAAKYFLEKEFVHNYFFARKDFDINSKNKNYNFVTINDLSNEENIEKAFSKIKVDHTASYFCLNTIGAYEGGKSISETDFSVWKKMIDINLDVSFLIAKHFSRLVKKAKGGSICFISAQSSMHPEKNRAAYNISKNALNFLVKTLALEGKNISMSANAVAPYVIDSPENQEWISDKKLLIKPLDICKTVDSIFTNYNVMNGNIIELPFGIK